MAGLFTKFSYLMRYANYVFFFNFDPVDTDDEMCLPNLCTFVAVLSSCALANRPRSTSSLENRS